MEAAHLEAATHMDDDKDRSHAHHPDWVSQGVQNLAGSLASKGMVASVSNAKVAVRHQNVSHSHPKLHQTNKQPLAVAPVMMPAGVNFWQDNFAFWQ